MIFANPLETDARDFKTILRPKLAGKQRPHLLCSMTYITPNYLTLFLLRELAKLSREGYEIDILLWDTNALTHQYSREIREREGAEAFIAGRIDELKRIGEMYGMDGKSLRIFRSTSVWKRLVLADKPPLFLAFYEMLMDVDLKDLTRWHKASHAVQLPLDIFFANFIDALYPEERIPAIDVVLAIPSKMEAYVYARERMMSNGYVKTRRPLLLCTEKLPYLMADNLFPEWDMPIEDVISIVSRAGITVAEAVQLAEYLLAEELSQFIVQRKGTRSVVGNKEFRRILPSLRGPDLCGTIGANIFAYLQATRARMPAPARRPEALHVSDRGTAENVGVVLRSKVLLDTLLLADGTRTVSQIARELKRNPGNVSVYVNHLKRMGFVHVEQRKVHRSVKAFLVNLDMDLPAPKQ